jgi:pimeloyl-ACP methyl ester carboxylesterase
MVMTASPRRTIRSNGVDLCVQTFGDHAAPAILLIAGGASSMDWWHDELCERLTGGGRFVIRYDHRDTGQSVAYPPGEPGYDGRDLVKDAVGLLDALEVDRAHVVGMSMGGAIAQQLALVHPGRVASLTLVSTSPAVSGNRELPPPSDDLRKRFSEPPPEPDWSDRDAVVDYLVDDARAYVGALPLDERAMRTLAARIVDRTRNVASSVTNNFVAAEGPPVQGRLGDIRAPTLVVHGTEDPLFPFEHGEALAAEIPGAQLLPLDGVGHEHPRPETWDELVPMLLEHTRTR